MSDIGPINPCWNPMKKTIPRTLLPLVLGWVGLCAPLAACSVSMPRSSGPSPLVPSSRQLVTVRTHDWGSITGTLQRYRRESSSVSWHPVDSPIPVVVGRHGLAWGIGLSARPAAPNEAPVKVEGDGKAPAGVFSFNAAFGYAPSGTVPWIRMPYVCAESTYKCVDDVGSRHYNTMVFEDRTAKDWSSSEDMLRQDDLYRLGLVVEHNWAPQTQKGKGSCIFLHIWRAPDKGTAGCTAMDPSNMELLLAWLDPEMHPLFVQLPESEYTRLRDSWGLP